MKPINPSAEILVPRVFGRVSNIVCGMSTRRGGVSPDPLGMNMSYSVGDDVANVRQNRAFMFGSIGRRESDIAFAGQCHSATVVIVDHPGMYPECDALVSAAPNVVLAVSVADCSPVLLCDPRRKVVASVHSGWRGTHQRIVANAVRCMEREFGSLPTDLLAYIGPCAGPCCYSVGPEVSSLFDEVVIRRIEEKTNLNLTLENRRQLQSAGLSAGNIEADGRCTICGPELFHSFRRDGRKSGRMLAFIGLTQDGDR